jgi:uncharacterized protein YjiS (DUF1127 family)
MKQSIAIQIPSVENFVPNAERFVGHIRRAPGSIKIWKQRHATRQHLVKVNADILVDVGLNGEQGIFEVHKWFWEQ